MCTHRQAPCSAGHSRDLGLDMGLTHRGRHSGRGRRHCRRNSGHLELPPGRLPTVRVTTRLDEQDFLWRRNGLPDNSYGDRRSRSRAGRHWLVARDSRDALCDFAGDSRHSNAWAADLYAKARARKCDHSHAVRILAPDRAGHADCAGGADCAFRRSFVGRRLDACCALPSNPDDRLPSGMSLRRFSVPNMLAGTDRRKAPTLGYSRRRSSKRCGLPAGSRPGRWPPAPTRSRPE